MGLANPVFNRGPRYARPRLFGSPIRKCEHFRASNKVLVVGLSPYGLKSATLRLGHRNKLACSCDTRLLVVHHMIIELAVVVAILGFADGDSILRVAVQHTRNHLRDDVTPFVLFLEREEKFLVGIEHRTQVVLRVLEETEEQLGGAVTCATAHARHGTVEKIHMVNNCLDRVAEGKLLVVVAMETELLVLHDSLVTSQFLVNVFLVEGPEAVDEVKHVGLAFFVHLVQGFVEFRTTVTAHGHDVEGCFVTHVVEGIHHLDTLVDVLHVACHAEHLVRAFAGGLHGVHVHAAHVSHHGHLDVGIDAVFHLPQEIVVAELPRTVILGVEEFRRILVTHFHIVHAGGRKECIEATHKFKREVVLVDETAIADGAVEDLDAFVVHSGYEVASL